MQNHNWPNQPIKLQKGTVRIIWGEGSEAKHKQKKHAKDKIKAKIARHSRNLNRQYA